MVMKSIIVSFFLLCFFKRGLFENMSMEELTSKCGELTDLDQVEVEKLNLTRPLETDDKRVKCFVRCMLTGLNVMTVEGILTLEGSTETLPYHKYFPNCKDVVGANSCEKAFSFQNCVLKQIELNEENKN